MDKSEYERLRREIKRAHEASIAAAEIELQKNLDAVDRVWKISQAGIAKPSVNGHEKRKPPFELIRKEQSAKGAVDASVRATVAKMGDKSFTWKRLAKLIQDETGKLVNRSSLMQVLRRMEKDGVVTILLQGIGRKPSVFRYNETVETST